MSTIVSHIRSLIDTLHSTFIAKTFNLVPHGAVFIDATIVDILRAFIALSINFNWETYYKKCQSHFSPNSLICISARTAFDIYLQVMSYPKGSHVLLTAITIPDMVKILRYHGLIPVPIDIDPNTFQPDIKSMERARCDKTSFVLFAHIYGRQVDIQQTVDFCQRYQIPLIEDCAESFSGPPAISGCYEGHPNSDIVLFSFGPIKYYSSFGNGVAIIRDTALLRKMEGIHSSYKIRTRYEEFLKILKYAFMFCLTDIPVFNLLFRLIFRCLGWNHNAWGVSMLRGFPGSVLIKKLRHRPTSSFLSILHYRLASFNEHDFLRSKKNGDMVLKLLDDVVQQPNSSDNNNYIHPNSVFIPGTNCNNNNHWLFPICISNPDKACELLKEKGVDVFRGTTQLACIDPPSDEVKNPEPVTNAKNIMDNLIYLPVNKRLSEYSIVLLTKRLKEVIKEIAKFSPPSFPNSKI